MGWWVYLQNETGENVEVEIHADGGTYAVGGTDSAELNITYNYQYFFQCAHPRTEDFRTALHGMVAKDIAADLAAIVKELGTDRNADYWAPHPGNVGHMVSILLAWAKQHPNATFRVS